MKILLAMDGSESSRAAVNSVAERPWPPGSEIKILSVAELPPLLGTEFGSFSPGYYEEMDKVAQELAQTAVKTALEFLQSRATHELAITTEIKTGPAKSLILEEAEQWGADLIVLGSHGYSGVQRFLLGSVSQAVATHAPCSVEIIRRKP